MRRYLLAVVAVVLAVPFALAAPVPAEGGKETPFPFPAKAPVVISVNGYDRARTRLNKMVATALPKEAEQLNKMIDEKLGEVLKDRKLTAVRKDARAFLVLNDLMQLTDETPAVSLLVPVASHKEFLNSFLTQDELKTLESKKGVDAIKTSALGDEKKVFLVDLKTYTAITLDRDTADTYAVKYTAATPEQMGAEVADTFTKADVAVYVNMDAINDQFGDQIRQFKGLIDFGIQQAQQQGAFGPLDKKQIEAVTTILKGLFQAGEDCRALVAAAEFQPEGLLVKLQGRFAANSASAKLIGSESPVALTEVAKLPRGLGLYQGNFFGKTIGSLFHELSQDFATTEDDAKGAATIAQGRKDLLAAGPGTEASALSPPDTTFIVTPYKEAEKAAKALISIYKAVAKGGRVNGVVLKTAPKVSEASEKHRGFALTEVQLTHDFEASVADLPEATKEATLQTLKRTVPEKAKIWIGTDGKVVVRVMAKDRASAVKLVDDYLDGKTAVGSVDRFKQVRTQLPAQANLLAIADVSWVIDMVIDQMKAVGENIPGFPQLDQIKKSDGKDPAYVGLAFALKGDTATVATYVPMNVVATVRKIFEPLFKKFE